MSIDYKVVEKGQPGIDGGGEKKFYAQIAYGKEGVSLKFWWTLNYFIAIGVASFLF